MELQDLIKYVLRNEKTRKQWRDKHQSEEWKAASKVNQMLYNKPLNRRVGCECLEDLYKLLKHRKTQNKIIMNKERKFILKDRTIMLHGCDPVTRNSSEEALIKILRKSKAHIVSFETYPENWEDIVDGKIGLDGAKATKPKAELKEADPEVEVKEVDELVEEIEAEGIDDFEKNADEPTNAFEKSELEEMTNRQLKELIVEMSIDMPKKTNKATLIKTILNA